jgi:hypothetical protein
LEELWGDAEIRYYKSKQKETFEEEA